MQLFVPATFDLFEFDDRSVVSSRASTTSRWFSHWDGLIGSPAEEVSLAWRHGTSAALVCTSGRSYDQADARARAAQLALGNVDLSVPNRPEDPASTFEEIERISTTSQLWQEEAALIVGELTTEAAVLDGFMMAYQLLASGGALFFAATALFPAESRVRVVQDWSPYGVDATTSVPLDTLRR